jgi:hypothetical protein
MKTEQEQLPRTDGRTAGGTLPPAEWRLPSGQSLAEFALASGLLARRLIEPRRKAAAGHDRERVRGN